MRLRTLLLTIIIALALCVPVFGQSASCLDDFHDFGVLNPNVNPAIRNETYEPRIAWYGDCILVGSSNGLWLYDPNQPDNPVQLAGIEDRAVVNVAVNPQTQSIAFNIAQEPTVYIIASDMSVSTIQATGDAVTAIAFSDDGNLTMVASSEILEYEGTGFYHDARVQIWNNEQPVTTLTSNVQLIFDVFITTDEQNVLTNGANSGYVGNVIEYWDLETASRLWDYSDLLSDLVQWTINDPLLVMIVSAQNHTLAFGGLDGYHDLGEYYGTAVHIWNADSQTRINEIIISRRGLGNDNNYLTGLDLNPDGSTLATVQNDGVVRLWNVAEGSVISETNISITDTKQIMFNTNGELLAVLGKDGIVILNTDPLEEIALFDGIGD
jgi:WD40 repeat protein